MLKDSEGIYICYSKYTNNALAQFFGAYNEVKIKYEMSSQMAFLHQTAGLSSTCKMQYIPIGTYLSVWGAPPQGPSLSPKWPLSWFLEPVTQQSWWRVDVLSCLSRENYTSNPSPSGSVRTGPGLVGYQRCSITKMHSSRKIKKHRSKQWIYLSSFYILGSHVTITIEGKK